MTNPNCLTGIFHVPHGDTVEDYILQARVVYQQKPLDQPPKVGISFVKLACACFYYINYELPQYI